MPNGDDMERLIWISTSRHSELFRRLIQQYRQGARVEIDGTHYSAADMDSLMAAWCTNEKIRATRNFGLWRNKSQLFGFHDGPSQLWAAYTELPFVEALSREHIARYRASQPQKSGAWSWIKRLLGT